jgi:hypothetical protein
MQELDKNNRATVYSMDIGNSGDAVTLQIHTHRGDMHMSIEIAQAQQMVDLLTQSIERATNFENNATA